MKNLIAYFAKQKILVNIISIVVFVVGLYALTHIQRELFPNIAFDFIQVTTVYPGASAEEVERLVTSPIEQDLKEVDGVKKIMSISVQGQSLIYIQLDPDQTTSDEAKSDVQDVIDKMSDLPNEAEKPVVVSLESKLRPIVEVSLSGDVSESVLREKAKLVQDKLEKIRSVAKVNFNGLRDYEIRVEALPQKLKQYHVSLNDLIFALKNQNLSIPGGVIEAIGPHKKEMIVRTIGEYKSLEDIKKTVVRANELAESIRVGDVARVKRVFEKRKYYERTNGHPAIYLTVLKKEKGDAIQLVDDVKAVMEKMKPLLGDKIHVSYINDMSYFVRRRLKVLTNNLAIGLVLVVLILSLVLPSRIAFITAFGIPFSFLGTVL
ncbi:MAG: efflux RND transporter permease subunit, partial [Bdellovibrio sp.]